MCCNDWKGTSMYASVLHSNFGVCPSNKHGKLLARKQSTTSSSKETCPKARPNTRSNSPSIPFKSTTSPHISLVIIAIPNVSRPRLSCYFHTEVLGHFYFCFYPCLAHAFQAYSSACLNMECVDSTPYKLHSSQGSSRL